MKKDRLLKLAKFLDKVKPQKFDLVTFATLDDNKPPSDKTCGSTGCAIGYCPEVFPDLCKYHNGQNSDYSDENLSHLIKFKDGETVDIVLKEDSSVENFGVATTLFDISLDHVKYLFQYTAYHKSHRGPKSVANRIRSYVHSYGDIDKKSKAYKQEYV